MSKEGVVCESILVYICYTWTGYTSSRMSTYSLITRNQEARDHIAEIIEAPALERKRNAWRVVGEVEVPDEQEDS